MASSPGGARWESAGWLFFFAAFVVLAVPGLYVSHLWRAPDAPPLAPYAGGILAAAIGAGVGTVIVNSFLQRRAESLHDTQPSEKKQNRSDSPKAGSKK